VFSRLLEPDYVTQDLSNILEVLYNIHLAAESFRMRDSVIRGIHNTEVIVPMDGRSPDLRIRDHSVLRTAGTITLHYPSVRPSNNLDEVIL